MVRAHRLLKSQVLKPDCHLSEGVLGYDPTRTLPLGSLAGTLLELCGAYLCGKKVVAYPGDAFLHSKIERLDMMSRCLLQPLTQGLLCESNMIVDLSGGSLPRGLL